MNNTDSMTVAAIRANLPLKFNNRQVIRENDVTTVLLHGSPCLQINHASSVITLSGHCMTSRKSSRMMNAILSSYTSYRVYSKKGRWFLLTHDGLGDIDFTGEYQEIYVTSLS